MDSHRYNISLKQYFVPEIWNNKNTMEIFGSGFFCADHPMVFQDHDISLDGDETGLIHKMGGHSAKIILVQKHNL